jgi:hypothetical protein
MVVPHFYTEDDGSTSGCDEVGNEKEDTNPNALLNAQHQTLTHKTEAAYRHHDEAWQRNTISLTGTDGLNSLWQIT